MMSSPAKRYSTGDRTDGLIKGSDGSVTIELAATRPSEDAAVNWLPVAPDAAFYLMMRLYRPQRAALDRTWVPPAIERIDR